MHSVNYVIVGAGQAGCVASFSIRGQDPQARITLIGDESHLPYERPALSKSVLAGTSIPESTIIKEELMFHDAAISVLLNRSVTQIDCRSKCVLLADGTAHEYDRLVLATGSRVRKLAIEGTDLGGVHYVRTLEDSVQLQASLRTARHLLVVGAGFIGLEVASTAKEHFKCGVTVVETGPEILQRGAPEELREKLRTLHESNNVSFLFNSTLKSLSGQGRVGAAFLDNGRKLDVDCVLISAGVAPNIDLASAAGIGVNEGIVTDEYGETSTLGVYAAGEVSEHINAATNILARNESWQMAQHQAAAVGRNAAGAREAFGYTPWFWTDQYGNNFQFLGKTETAAYKAIRQSVDERASTTVYLEDNRVVGGLCINSGRDIRPIKQAIETGNTVSVARLSDSSLLLKKAISMPRGSIAS